MLQFYCLSCLPESLENVVILLFILFIAILPKIFYEPFQHIAFLPEGPTSYKYGLFSLVSKYFWLEPLLLYSI